MSDRSFYGMCLTVILGSSAVDVIFDESIGIGLRVMTTIALLWCVVCVVINVLNDARRKVRR